MDVTTGTKAPCPKCGREVELDQRMLVGEVVTCEYCAAHLEVAELDPLRLERWARIEEDEEDFEELRS
ncbi:MAG: lysine biosynthesis protein LysW [Planctomycetota bacterium]|nr:lysine biosynthesis protein LysW [Planctomycetota bacterium]